MLHFNLYIILYMYTYIDIDIDIDIEKQVDDVATDVAQQKRNNNKCYISAFRYI